MAKKSIFRLFRGDVPSQPEMRIFVRGLRVEAFIGVHPHEYERRQPIIMDIEPVSYTHLTLPTKA